MRTQSMFLMKCLTFGWCQMTDRRHPIYTLRLYTAIGVRHHRYTSYIIYSCNIFGLNSFTRPTVISLVVLDWRRFRLTRDVRDVYYISGASFHKTYILLVLTLYYSSHIFNIKNNKAPGPSGIAPEMLKAAGEAGVQWVTDMCNATNMSPSA